MAMSQLQSRMSERTLCVAYATTVVGLVFLMAAAFWYGPSIGSLSTPWSKREILLWHVFCFSELSLGVLTPLGICGAFLAKTPLYSWIYMAGAVECVASIVMFGDLI